MSTREDHWRARPGPFAAFALPSFGWLLVFFLVPLALIFAYSFGRNVSYTEVSTFETLDNYARIAEPALAKLMGRTLWLSALATAICLAVGMPLAMVIATAPGRWKPWLLLLVILPFWTNLLIRTYALLNILGTRGRLNETLRWVWTQADAALSALGLEGAIGARYVPIRFLGEEAGVVIGLVYVALPFAVLPIYASLERLDRSLLEASMDLGAGQWATFWRVLVPLTAGGIVSAAIITFIPTLGSFVTPDLLGRGQVDMIANVISRQFKRANDWPFGSALSLVLLYATFAVLALQAWLAARSRSVPARAQPAAEAQPAVGSPATAGSA